MIQAIIFDFAGVIGADGLWVWLRKHIPDIEEKKHYFQELSERLDNATITHEEFMGALSKESGQSEEEIWREVKSYIVINQELVAYIQTLKPKYKIALLSNFTHTWLREILTENNLWDLFDMDIISSEHGIIKPHPPIFEKMISMLGIDPSAGIFVDDRQIHVDGAQRVGLHAVLFTDTKQLQKDFETFGVVA